jgi:acyl dehydratase
MTALAFAQLKVGQQFALGPLAVSEADILAFADQFDPQPFHLDEAVAKASILGGLAASGWHTSSLLMRMLCDAFFLKIKSMGSTGIDEMKWLKPVYGGDVLSGVMTLTQVRPSASRPGFGVVAFEASLADQNGQTKASLRSMVLVRV